MNKLSEKFVAVLVEKNLLHPIPTKDMYQTLKNLLYAFIARDNPAKDSIPNRTRSTSNRRPSTSSCWYVKS